MQPLIGLTILVFSQFGVTSGKWVDPATRMLQKNATYELVQALFGTESKYTKETRHFGSGPIHVTIGMKLRALADIDEKSQTMQTVMRMLVSWVDHHLVWDSSKYGGIGKITMKQENIWLPDFEVLNSVEPPHQLGYKELPAKIYFDGDVYWNPTMNTRTSCDIDSTFYPFDTQKCEIIVSTIASSSLEIFIEVFQEFQQEYALNDYQQDGTWKLIDSRLEADNTQAEPKVVFSLLLQRRNTFYLVSIIFPVYFLSFTASLVFALPADCGEKMGTSITVLLAYAVYVTMVTEYLPDSALTISLLALYLTCILGYTAMAVVLTAFILRLHHRDPSLPVGPKIQTLTRFLRCLTCQCMATKLLVEECDDRNDPADQNEQGPYTHGKEPGDKREPSGKETMTWQIVAETVDWFFFLLFSTLVTLTTTAGVVGLVVWSERYKPVL